MTAFDGASFWFNGVPGSFYNLVSEPELFQVRQMAFGSPSATYGVGDLTPHTGKSAVFSAYLLSRARFWHYLSVCPQGSLHISITVPCILV